MTRLATVVVAAIAGAGSARLFDRLLPFPRNRVAVEPTIVEDPYSF